MKKALLYVILFLLFFYNGEAQTITTFAGGGSSLGDGGSASSALIDNPGDVTISKDGVLYITSGNRIRKIDKLGIITTVAGTGATGYSGDGGQATNAKINFATGIATDNLGDVFFADLSNNTIRKIDHNTGMISAVCGNGTSGYSGDNGPASSAKIYGPGDICFDKAGNLYFGDNNHVVRKITPSGIITTFAGTGIYGFSGDGTQATNAQLYYPLSVTSDELGNIYISDQGNNRIRKVNTSGVISTYAGNGGVTYGGNGMPATNAQFNPSGIKIDLAHYLYIAGDSRVSYIDHFGTFHTLAGTGVAGFSGDGGPAISSQFDHIHSLTLDTCANLYITDGQNNRIRKISFTKCNFLEVESRSISNTNPSIYPNPVSNILHIDNIESRITYRILDVVGIPIQIGSLVSSNSTISVQYLPNGIYILEMVDENAFRSMHKFVKR